MATIKDIAKKAGVAQGTVSNVLNGKGNVSSDKIRRVLEAARQLGYVPNERAALLRKGTNDCLALVMPDSRARQYEDFYFSFKDYAQEHGYLVSRHLTNENSPESEVAAFSEAKVRQVKGIACISAVAGTASETVIYKNSGILGKWNRIQIMGLIFRYFLWTGKQVFLLILLGLIMKKRDRPWQRRHCRRDIEASVCLQEIRIIPVKKISAEAS